MTLVGVSVVDITPPPGGAMAGFAARQDAARGGHDALTARALVVDDTAFVSVDVIGIDAAFSARIRRLCPLPDGNVTIAATHTHGGPVSMPGRLSVAADPVYIQALERGVLLAIEQAAGAREPARLYAGCGAEPGFATNRRHADGPLDRGVPVMRFDRMDGSTIAHLVSYACHPVVLGADNLLWTADYPHFARKALEEACPGSVAVFATGCAGDVNTGHSAAASLSAGYQADRTYARAMTIGKGVAQSALAADMVAVSGPIGCAEAFADLRFESRESGTADELARAWRAASRSPGDIHHIWADWAGQQMGRDLEPMRARCTALSWGGVLILSLPGEIFAQTALELRQDLGRNGPDHVIAYADDNPGYIPPLGEYAVGGYEVDEAHRFYGMGASIAPGVAEALSSAAQRAAGMAANPAAADCTIKKSPT
ncbi:neutral/alkaline non-lysosomal ceramidase N-terminal domain-containing protein [Ponticoccus alexandrii]|uniref:Alkaline ceramidase n=1 Tax=Ponticoccus alexandrii TaxID=1943633 RepID=A0ABX7FHF1_9RHOB|nr:neutral/alkaline non-lysosomal ceramidase N-terminal domain-containing protein [Ponticoccus alexandrii]QRF69069.1 alkaline ceramidase [Ponticoccus alexandrii]